MSVDHSSLSLNAGLGQSIEREHTLIVGGGGRLARAFAFLWPRASILRRGDLDITSREAVLRTIADIQPRIIINCAANTDMHSCENDPAGAWAVNVFGVRNLSEAARQINATLVHFSSDYALSPVNEYGWTKLGSEPFADLTIRAKIYDGSHWAWEALRAGNTIQMSTLEHSNPISTTSIVDLTTQLLQRGARGLVQAGTAHRLSFYEIGRAWAAALGAPEQCVLPIGEVNSPTPRLTEMYLPPAPVLHTFASPPSILYDATCHKLTYDAYSSLT